MMSELFDKLKAVQKNTKKDVKKNINPNSAFGTLTDEEIAYVMALRAKKLRIASNQKQSELSKKANLSSPTTYSNFEQTGKISFLNFIKVIRTLGRLNELETMLQESVRQKIDTLKTKEKQRVKK
jgi:DNA-binding phage protein